MRQFYYCPNCRASIFYGEKFCGNCGTSLKWMVVKTPPPDQYVSYNRPHTEQQPMRYSPPGWYIMQPDRQEKPVQKTALQKKKAFPKNQSQHGQRQENGSQPVTSGKKRAQAEDPVRVLRSEVSELLIHLFQKVE